jgi:hypothetical protein
LDAVFLKFKSFVQELVSPIFTFEMKQFAWYKKADLIDLALRIALMNCYAEGYTKALRKEKKKKNKKERKSTPTSETFLDYLKTQNINDILEIAKTQIAQCTELLVKKGVTLNNLAIAFDWHDVRFYGKHDKEGVLGTKPERGTSYAYCYLTVSVITPRKRLVLAVIPLKSREELAQIILPLLDQIMQYVKKLSYVAFDNGFQDSKLLQALIDRNIPYIIPLRDTVKLHKRWKWKRYLKRFNYNTQGVWVDVVEALDSKGLQYFLATNLPGRPKRILKLYKKRWGIETSYRMIGQFLGKTTCDDYAVRVCYFVLAVLLYNVWVLLNVRVREHVIVVELKLSCLWSSQVIPCKLSDSFG